LSNHLQKPDQILAQVQARIQEEISRLGERLEAIERGMRELRAQFESSSTVVKTQFENLDSFWRAANGASVSESVSEERPRGALRPMGHVGETDLSHSTDAEQKLHRDAMRYARLLVSEIELYNRDEVEQGRSHKDLYRRLKSHIDRSRQAYESRFGPAVIGGKNYFHEEIVRTLARSDATLLGPDYPLPAK
jgi:hypothetical protein